MSNPPRAADIVPAPSGSTSRAKLAQRRGPQIPHYSIMEDTGDIYRWIVGDTTTADGFNVLSHSGGTDGRWHRIVPGGDPFGTDLTNADATVAIADGRRLILPASTLTANHILTLSTTGAKAGDEIRITRLDVEAFTYTVNNGLDDSAILVFDESVAGWAAFHYRSDAVGWIQVEAGALL